MKIFKYHISRMDLVLGLLLVIIATLGGFAFRLSESALLVQWGLKSRPLKILISSREIFPESVETELTGYLGLSLNVQELDFSEKLNDNYQSDYDFVIGPICELVESGKNIDWNQFEDLTSYLAVDFQGLQVKAPKLFPIMWQFKTPHGIQVLAMSATDSALTRSVRNQILNPQFLQFWRQQIHYQSTGGDQDKEPKLRSISLKDLLNENPFRCLEKKTK